MVASKSSHFDVTHLLQEHPCVSLPLQYDEGSMTNSGDDMKKLYNISFSKSDEGDDNDAEEEFEEGKEEIINNN